MHTGITSTCYTHKEILEPYDGVQFLRVKWAVRVPEESRDVGTIPSHSLVVSHVPPNTTNLIF